MSNDSLTPCSLTRFLIEETRAGRINPALRRLIEVVARACKTIPVAVGKGEVERATRDHREHDAAIAAQPAAA